MKKIKLIGPLIILFTFFVNAQNDLKQEKTCGSKSFFIEKMKDEEFKLKYEKEQKVIYQIAQNKANLKSAPCANPIIIPIAVHYNEGVTVADEDCLIATAKAQIAVLNEDFGAYNEDIALFCQYSSGCSTNYNPNDLASNGACIQFCLADKNLPAGEDNIGGYGITIDDYKWTGGVDAPKWAGYLNLFIYEDAATAGYLGVAPYAGGYNPNGNGVFISYKYFGGKDMPDGCISGNKIGGNAPYNLGRTGTHEVGHYFALDHTFDNYNGTTNCTGSDFFDASMDDTPSQSVENYGSPVIDYNDCSSTANNSCGEADYFFNFMDYVNDISMLMFTENQASVMSAVASPQSKWNTNAIDCYDEYQSGNLTYNPIFENGCPSNCFDVTYTGNDGFRIKLFLEGFVDASQLTNALSVNNLIPNLQPYNYAPFNYDGSEYMYGFSTSIVDWVYLEALDANDNIMAARAALLTTSGKIIDVDGGDEIHFPCLNAGTDYSLAVYHKSHVGVIANTVVNYPATSQYDFTTGTDKVRGNNQLKNVGGEFCLHAGDFDGSGIVNNQDFNKWASASALVNNYVTWDVDGSGIVNNLDYNLWENNRAKVGEPIIQK